MPPKKQRTPALRKKIKSEALSLLERKGPAGLRARAVAEAAGTSTGAIYELFGGKGGLVRSIYEEGYSQLETELDELAPSDDAAEDVRELFRVIRRFARKKPHLFEVMFARPFEEFEPGADGQEPARSLFSVVVDRVTRWLGQVDSSADAVDVSRVLISASRGLITEDTTPVFGSTPVSRDRRWDLAFDLLMSGITNRDRAVSPGSGSGPGSAEGA